MKTNRLCFFSIFFFYENRQLFLKFNLQCFFLTCKGPSINDVGNWERSKIGQNCRRCLWMVPKDFFLRHCRSLILLYELVGRKIIWTVRKKMAEIEKWCFVSKIVLNYCSLRRLETLHGYRLLICIYIFPP